MTHFQQQLYSRIPSPIQGAAAAASPSSAISSPSNEAEKKQSTDLFSNDPTKQFLTDKEKSHLEKIDSTEITFQHCGSQELNIPLFKTKEFVLELVTELKKLLDHPSKDVLVQGSYLKKIVDDRDDYKDIDLCFECKKLENSKEFIQKLDEIFVKLILARLPDSFKKGKKEEDLTEIIRNKYLDRFRRCPPPDHYMYTLSLKGAGPKDKIDLCFIQKGTYPQGAAVSDFLRVAYLAPKPYFITSHGIAVKTCIDHLKGRIYAIYSKIEHVHAALWRLLSQIGQGNLILFSKEDNPDKLLSSLLKDYPVDLMAIKLETLDGKPFPQDEEGQTKWQAAHEVFEEFRKKFKNHLEKHTADQQGTLFALLNLLNLLSTLKGLKPEQKQIYFRSLAYIWEILPGHRQDDPFARFLKNQSEDVPALLDLIQGAFLFEWMKAGKEKGVFAYAFDFAKNNEPRLQISVGDHFLALNLSPDQLAVQFLKAWGTLEQKSQDSREKQEMLQGILKRLAISSLELLPEHKKQVVKTLLKDFTRSPVIEVLDNQFGGNLSLKPFYQALASEVTEDDDRSYLQKKLLECELKIAIKQVGNSSERLLLDQCLQLINQGATPEQLQKMILLLKQNQALTKKSDEQAAADNSSKAAPLVYQDLLKTSLNHAVKDVLARPTPENLPKLQLLTSAAVESKIFEESSKQDNNKLIIKNYLAIANSGEEGVLQLLALARKQIGEVSDFEQEKNGYFCLRAIAYSKTTLSEPMKKELSEILDLYIHSVGRENHPLFFQFFGLVLKPFFEGKLLSHGQQETLIKTAFHKFSSSDSQKETALDLLKMLGVDQAVFEPLLSQILDEMIDALAKENEKVFKSLLEKLASLPICTQAKDLSEKIEKLKELNPSKRDPAVLETFIAIAKQLHPQALEKILGRPELFCTPLTKKILLELYVEKEVWDEIYTFLTKEDLTCFSQDRIFDISMGLLKAIVKDSKDKADKIEKVLGLIFSILENRSDQAYGKKVIELLKLVPKVPGGYDWALKIFACAEKQRLLTSQQASQIVTGLVKWSLDTHQLPPLLLAQRCVKLLENDKKFDSSPVHQDLFQRLIWSHLLDQEKDSQANVFLTLKISVRSDALIKVLPRLFAKMDEAAELPRAAKLYRQAFDNSLIDEKQHPKQLSLFMKAWIKTNTSPDSILAEQFFGLEYLIGSSSTGLIEEQLEGVEFFVKHHPKQKAFPILLKRIKNLVDDHASLGNGFGSLPQMIECLMKMFPAEWIGKCPHEKELHKLFNKMFDLAPSEPSMAFLFCAQDSIYFHLLKTELSSLRAFAQPFVMASQNGELWELWIKTDKKENNQQFLKEMQTLVQRKEALDFLIKQRMEFLFSIIQNLLQRALKDSKLVEPTIDLLDQLYLRYSQIDKQSIGEQIQKQPFHLPSLIQEHVKELITIHRIQVHTMALLCSHASQEKYLRRACDLLTETSLKEFDPLAVQTAFQISQLSDDKQKESLTQTFLEALHTAFIKGREAEVLSVFNSTPICDLNPSLVFGLVSKLITLLDKKSDDDKNRLIDKKFLLSAFSVIQQKQKDAERQKHLETILDLFFIIPKNHSQKKELTDLILPNLLATVIANTRSNTSLHKKIFQRLAEKQEFYVIYRIYMTIYYPVFMHRFADESEHHDIFTFALNQLVPGLASIGMGLDGLAIKLWAFHGLEKLAGKAPKETTSTTKISEDFSKGVFKNEDSYPFSQLSCIPEFNDMGYDHFIQIYNEFVSSVRPATQSNAIFQAFNKFKSALKEEVPKIPDRKRWAISGAIKDLFFQLTTSIDDPNHSVNSKIDKSVLSRIRIQKSVAPKEKKPKNMKFKDLKDLILLSKMVLDLFKELGLELSLPDLPDHFSVEAKRSYPQFHRIMTMDLELMHSFLSVDLPSIAHRAMEHFAQCCDALEAIGYHHNYPQMSEVIDKLFANASIFLAELIIDGLNGDGSLDSDLKAFDDLVLSRILKTHSSNVWKDCHNRTEKDTSLLYLADIFIVLMKYTSLMSSMTNFWEYDIQQCVSEIKQGLRGRLKNRTPFDPSDLPAFFNSRPEHRDLFELFPSQINEHLGRFIEVGKLLNDEGIKKMIDPRVFAHHFYPLAFRFYAKCVEQKFFEKGEALRILEHKIIVFFFPYQSVGGKISQSDVKRSFCKSNHLELSDEEIVYTEFAEILRLAHNKRVEDKEKQASKSS